MTGYFSKQSPSRFRSGAPPLSSIAVASTESAEVGHHNLRSYCTSGQPSVSWERLDNAYAMPSASGNQATKPNVNNAAYNLLCCVCIYMLCSIFIFTHCCYRLLTTQDTLSGTVVQFRLHSGHLMALERRSMLEQPR
jgi:hypothetical protein